MRFNIVSRAGAWWPVIVRLPADGGAVVEQEFEAKFLFRTAAIDGAAELTNAEWLDQAAADWRGIALDGRELRFADAADRAAGMELQGVMPALVRAWRSFLAAEPETRLGNSAASPGSAPAAAEADRPAPASPTA